MIRDFFKTFLLFSMMFASQEGFATQLGVEKLYQEKLKTEYSKLESLKQSAEKRKTAYIVSGVLALMLFLTFAYFFKLLGVIAALIMIGIGYFTLKSSEPVIGVYEQKFKENIISPITELVADFKSGETALSEVVLKESHLFAPRVKQFASWDLYQKKGVEFSYIHVEFDTKENASVERMAENIFDGYLIMIDKKNVSEGVLVSETLRDKVAHMDMTMGTFFAKGTYNGKQNGFDIYGEVSPENRDKASQFKNEKIAISFQRDKTYIAFYKQSNPFSVSIFKEFDVSQAKQYATDIQEIEKLFQALK